MQKSKRIKWSLVDLTRPASELAAELGTTRQAIYAARRRLGIEVENSAGGARAGAGAPQGNSNRKGKTLANSMTPYQLRIPCALLELVKEEAARKRLTASEIIRLALVMYFNANAHHAEEKTTFDTRTPDTDE